MQDLVEKLAVLMEKKKVTLAVAESCTGGMLSSAITARSGASTNFERGFITYSNEAKIELLNVAPEVIENKGAVSRETAETMALGAVNNSHAEIAVSITGVAGPDGGSEDKPVGRVYIAYADSKQKTSVNEYNFSGNRQSIREQSTRAALEMLIKELQEKSS
ncbi:MAG: CinA family protein [Alphaproteobacteria bacterium]